MESIKNDDVSVLITQKRYIQLIETEAAMEKIVSNNYKDVVCFFWEDKSFKKFYIPDDFELRYRGILK